MVPFQVVEVVNIPETLRDRFQSRDNSAMPCQEGYQRPAPAPCEEHSSALPVPSKLVRTKYGAWYLPPRTWKLRKQGEVSGTSLLRTTIRPTKTVLVFRMVCCCSTDIPSCQLLCDIGPCQS